MSARNDWTSALGPGREFDRIREILRGPDAGDPTTGVWVGPGDDATVLADGLVLSTDLAIESIHFRFDWLSAHEAGYRAAAAGVSDLAAMAARPVGLLVSLAVPRDGALAPRLMEGVKSLAQDVGAVILGGDLTRSPGPCLIDVVAVGRLGADREPLLRSSAGADDELWVTGNLGGAAAAVYLLRKDRPVPDALRRRLAKPVPRIREARWLVDVGVRCGIDLSDGIAGDAGHIAAASGVGVIVESHALPLTPGLQRWFESGGGDAPGSPVHFALHGGEDYELCVAAAPGVLGPRASEFVEMFGIRLTRVGRVVEGEGVRIVTEPGASPEPVDGGGWDHFGDDAT